jgi:acetyl-CoA acetyltransferase family protein
VAWAKGVLRDDDGIRDQDGLKKLGKLRTVFARHHGSVTAGNASQITDGAVALLVGSEQAALSLGLTPLGRLEGYAYAGCDPARMGLGPVYAIHKLYADKEDPLAGIDLFEINEAFAAQVIACTRAMASPDFCRTHLGRDNPMGEVPTGILNVNGGGVALGHPVGASGARLILTALLELRRRDQQTALVSLCVGGGQGAALRLKAG